MWLRFSHTQVVLFALPSALLCFLGFRCSFSVYFKLILIKKDNERLSFIMQITQRRRKAQINEGVDKQTF